MRIAIYNTNPLVRNADAVNDHYGQMFEEMLAPLVLGAEFVHFDVVCGEFPDDPLVFDAVVITGSSAFVTDAAAWVAKLFAHIREIDQAETKLFAVCFGHQAVAMALGGSVENRPIVLGAPEVTITETKSWMEPAASKLRLFSGNFQQVVDVPETMEVLATHPDCPVVMMAKADHLLTVQCHPEFSAAYMHRYLDQISNDVTPKASEVARQAFDAGSDGAVFAEWAAAFLTQ